MTGKTLVTPGTFAFDFGGNPYDLDNTTPDWYFPNWVHPLAIDRYCAVDSGSHSPERHTVRSSLFMVEETCEDIHEGAD